VVNHHEHYFLVDIDGTIADNASNTEWREGDPVDNYATIEHIMSIVKLIADTWATPVFTTCRTDATYRAATETWLNEHYARPFILEMMQSPSDDPAAFKVAIAEKYAARFAFEDNVEICIELESNGVPIIYPRAPIDRLESMFARQYPLSAAWGLLPDPADANEVSAAIFNTVGYLHTELVEMLNEVHWKHWKTPRGFANKAKFREELADVFHWLIHLAFVADLSAEDLFRDYVRKNNKNVRRLSDSAYLGVGTFEPCQLVKEGN